MLALTLATLACERNAVERPVDEVLAVAAIPAARDPRCAPSQVRVTTAHVDVCIDLYEWPGFGVPPTELDFDAAVAACASRDARLCTEAEWEAACRGPSGFRFPYGDDFVSNVCNVAALNVGGSGLRNGCRSAFGAYDMSGNAAEWVAGRVLKGGDFTADEFGSRCGARSRLGPIPESSLAGARCCAAPTER